ncbi:Hypothetical protein R9X50_00358300 [Acrodontium crateriforme]|uniref:Cell division cycle protein 123 n=1 Tax=Acrodontium crateriforme TaxID=150365 RepID=A0AAQ3M3W4_9PEZI|nr:Hypothetical protein R9X50_00358300 [Acrodontium crateriforme]
MPEILDDMATTPTENPDKLTHLPFPPVTRAHILNCSYHSWHPKYRTITPKARLIPLTQPFLDYLRSDGIILPDDEVRESQQENWSDHDSGIFSSSDNPDAQDSDSEDDGDGDVAAEWRDVHNNIKSVIAELGGNVVPKLNWSAPKDATWMNANSMECRQPNDVYLLLKSSDFITHDLEHAFDDCAETPEDSTSQLQIPYHLVLRKYVQVNPSVEFRCFVRRRRLLAMCQRDLNHFEFLFPMQHKLASLIQEFFDVRLRDTFPDENFAFDVYVPAPHTKAWLVDINPWAPRTDPLLFSWLELLEMDEPPVIDANDESEQFVRLSLNPSGKSESTTEEDDAYSEDDEDSDFDEEIWLPELRLIKRSDPEAFAFSTQQYSAHKMPKDVVDAAAGGEGLREFARDWQNILAKRREEDAAAHSSDED